MPKISKKTGKKRTVTCSTCDKTGHNARTCPTKNAPKPTPAPKPEPKTQHRVPRRAAPTADIGTAATASPYRCPKCNQVAILVIVKVKDHNMSHKLGREVFSGEMRCEQCMNKPTPSDLILVWGATPDQKVEDVDA